MKQKMYQGLSKKEVLENQKRYGKNTISKTSHNSFLKLLVASFGDPIVKILLIVLAVKTVFLFQNFDWFETLGILIAILLASFISSLSEYGSEKAFEQMQEEASLVKCKCFRDGELVEVDIDEIVTNDIVKLTAGDMIPADAIILEGSILVDESSFTGETIGMQKDMRSEVYRGSTVLNGQAIIKIKNVGTNTKYGKIALELIQKNPESPLKTRLKGLADIISKIGYTGAILVSISYLFSVIFVANNFDWSLICEILTTPKILFGHIIYALTLSVTIIIVSVPEGLPMMVALVLSSNMKRMVKQNVLVRRMVGIETAGSLNVLFSDKTGTITTGNMNVVGIILGNGKFVKNINSLDKSSLLYKNIVANLKLNNEASVSFNKEIIGGNITDKAIMNYVKSYEASGTILKSNSFDSNKKYSSILIDDGITHELIKGAPEVLITGTTEYYSQQGKREKINQEFIMKIFKEYAECGYRLLLLADRPSRYAETLVFLGMIVLKDEISESAKSAIKEISDAGVQIIMITGDAKDSAIGISKEIGLLTNQDDLVLTSDDIKTMSDDKISSIFPKIKVIARALPEDKSRLVRIGQKLGKTVGMTGDGVNDAPALKLSDVGFAMGTGSEVSKEASDIVILDNNLKSISNAILYGRTIFKSIRKFIIFQLTMNLCALTLSIVGPFIGISTPVTVMQMLWINMIMDTLAGLAFSFEPAELEYMKEKPIKKNEPILNKYMYSSIAITGIYTALLLILFLKVPFLNSFVRPSYDNRYLLTVFFGLFVFSGLANSLNARTSRINIFVNLKKNIPFIIIVSLIAIVQIIILYSGGSTFRTYGLTLKEFIIMLLLSLSVIPVDLFRKILFKKLKI